MVQITIDGDIKFSKTHFESLEEFLIEIQGGQESVFDLTDEQKRILDERIAFIEAHPEQAIAFEDFKVKMDAKFA